MTRKLRRTASVQQNRFLWKFHPVLAKRFAARLKRSTGKKHPVRSLPKYSKTQAAKAARRRKKR